MASTTPTTTYNDENEMSQQVLAGLDHLTDEKKAAIMAAELVTEKSVIANAMINGVLDVNQLSEKVKTEVEKLFSKMQNASNQHLHDDVKRESLVHETTLKLQDILTKGVNNDVTAAHIADLTNAINEIKTQDEVIISLDKGLIVKLHNLELFVGIKSAIQQATTPPLNQSKVDAARAEVAKMKTHPIKNDFNDMLDDIEEDIELTPAIEAIATAEKTKDLNDYNHAVQLWENSKPSDKKDALENRLIALLDIMAENAVIAAETASTKTQELHDDADIIVSAMEYSGTNKIALANRLKAVQDAINIAKIESQATTAVDEAERADPKDRTLYENAFNIVTTLLPATNTVRSALETRLDGILDAVIDEEVKPANAALTKAESTKNEKDCLDAANLVNGLKDSRQKNELVARGNKLFSEIIAETEKATEDTINILESSSAPDQPNHDAAKKLWGDIPNASTKKADLARRLSVVQGTIHRLAQEAAATTAVVTAETSQDQADHVTAERLVRVLGFGSTKTRLEDRLEIVQKEIYAISAVNAAETATPLTQKTHDDAMPFVQDLPAGNPTRASLETRLDALQNVITVQQEKEAEKAVRKAETTTPPEQSLHDAAEVLVGVLKNVSVKTDLKDRLKIVQDAISNATLVTALNVTPTFTSLEVEQGADDPVLEMTNAIMGEKISVVYPSTGTRSGLEKGEFNATTGTNCDMALTNLKTDRARPVILTIKRSKNGVEGAEIQVKLIIKPAPTLPEKPDDLVDSIALKGRNKTHIKATLKDKTHTVTVLDASKRSITAIRPSIDTTTGELELDVSADDLGMTYNGQNFFYIQIENAKGQKKLCRITATVTGKADVVEDLEKPDFELPTDEIVQGKDTLFPIKLKNAIKGTKVEIEITNPSGWSVKTATIPTLRSQGEYSISQLGKMNFRSDGTHKALITYTHPDGTSESHHMDFEVKKAPAPAPLALPEGIPDTIDVTSEPCTITGKVKDKTHRVQLLDEHGRSLSPSIIPTVEADGSFKIVLPKFGSGEHVKKYKVRVSSSSVGGATPPPPLDQPITVNKKIAPKGNLRIVESKHDFVHQCEHARDHGHGQFHINGQARPIDIHHASELEGVYGLRKEKHTYWVESIDLPSPPPEDIEAHSPEELYKKIRDHLITLNKKEKIEYDARWGLATDEPEDDHDKTDKDHEKKDPKHPEGEKPQAADGTHEHHHEQGGITGGLKQIGKGLVKITKGTAKNALVGAGFGLTAAVLTGSSAAFWPVALTGLGVGHVINQITRKWDGLAKWYGPTKAEQKLYEKMNPGKHLGKPSIAQTIFSNVFPIPLGGILRYFADKTRTHESHGEEEDKKHAGHVEHTYHYDTGGSESGH